MREPAAAAAVGTAGGASEFVTSSRPPTSSRSTWLRPRASSTAIAARRYTFDARRFLYFPTAWLGLSNAVVHWAPTDRPTKLVKPAIRSQCASALYALELSRVRRRRIWTQAFCFRARIIAQYSYTSSCEIVLFFSCYRVCMCYGYRYVCACYSLSLLVLLLCEWVYCSSKSDN